MTEQYKHIFSAFVNAQKNFEKALKTSSNPVHRSKYADLSTCFEAVKSALHDQEIAFFQKHHDLGDNYIAVETVFIHSSGEQFSNGIIKLPAVRYAKDGVEKYDSQSFASASTYARRYSLMAACGLAPEDDDGNHSSGYTESYQSTHKPAINKPRLQQKLESIRENKHSNPKSKEELILDGEKACLMGTQGFRDWWPTLLQTEKDLIKDEIENFHLKCKEADALNQDIQQ